MCCAMYAGNIEVLPISSNWEPDFKSHLPASSFIVGACDGAGVASFVFLSCFLYAVLPIMDGTM